VRDLVFGLNFNPTNPTIFRERHGSGMTSEKTYTRFRT
jgi:hypothetical protein